MADPIRVLLVDMPRIPRELIERAVAGEEDMIVVGSTPDLEELQQAAAASEPEFVLVGLVGDQLPPTAARFVQDKARLKVLGVEAHDGKAYLYELRPERAPLGEVSPADVVAAIRRAASPTRSSTA
jgi:DNA-binding NarL/FixJ family response regulator